MVCSSEGNTSTTTRAMNYTSPNHSKLINRELNLNDLASLNGGAVPILPAVILGGIGYLVYKGAKKVLNGLDAVDQNLDTGEQCCSEGSNKLSYHDGIKNEEDPFNGSFTVKK